MAVLLLLLLQVEVEDLAADNMKIDHIAMRTKQLQAAAEVRAPMCPHVARVLLACRV